MQLPKFNKYNGPTELFNIISHKQKFQWLLVSYLLKHSTKRQNSKDNKNAKQGNVKLS